MNRRRFIKVAALSGLYVPELFAITPQQRAAVLAARSKTPVGASGPWTPQTPGGLVEWIKADSLSLNDGDEVTTWTAAVGQNLSSAATQYPLFKTNIKNGLPAVRFDGSNDYMKCATFGTVAQPYTALIVYSLLSSTTNQRFLDGIGASNRLELMKIGTVLQVYAGSGPTFFTSAPAPDTNWHIAFLHVDGSGANTATLVLDGSSAYVSNAAIGTQSLTGITLGVAYNLTTEPANIDVGELCIWTGSLSASDKTAALTYANSRWAIY